MSTLLPEKMTDLEAARVVDSLGSLSIGCDRSRGYWYEQFRLSGELELLRGLRDRFGGSLSSNGRHCAMIWRVTADVCASMLRQVRPYIRERADLVDLLLEFNEQRSRPVEVTHQPTKTRMAQLGPEFRRRLHERKRAGGNDGEREIRIGAVRAEQ